MRLVQLALQVRHADHDEQVAPEVGVAQRRDLTQAVRREQLRARRDAAAGDAQCALALQAVEVLDEAAAVGAQVVALDDEGEQRVQLIEGVEDAEEVARAAVGREDEEVA